MKQYSVREMQRILESNGFHKVRQHGSHQIWKREDVSVALPVTHLKSVICCRLIKEHHMVVCR